jgi:hypothetical protein
VAENKLDFYCTLLVYFTTNLNQVGIAFIICGNSGIKTARESFCWAAYIKVPDVICPSRGDGSVAKVER